MEKDDVSLDVSDQDDTAGQPKVQDFDTYADALWWGLVRNATRGKNRAPAVCKYHKLLRGVLA